MSPRRLPCNFYSQLCRACALRPAAKMVDAHARARYLSAPAHPIKGARVFWFRESYRNSSCRCSASIRAESAPSTRGAVGRATPNVQHDGEPLACRRPTHPHARILACSAECYSCSSRASEAWVRSSAESAGRLGFRFSRRKYRRFPVSRQLRVAFYCTVVKRVQTTEYEGRMKVDQD